MSDEQPMPEPLAWYTTRVITRPPDRCLHVCQITAVVFLTWLSVSCFLMSAKAQAAWSLSGQKEQGYPVNSRSEAKLVTMGSNEFRVSIVISSRGAVLTAAKGHSAALYQTKLSTVKGHTFKAHFGGFGKVSVTFRPRSGVSSRKGQGACGFKLRVRSGIFIGDVHFRGESNFTHVDLQRITGSVAEPNHTKRSGCASDNSRFAKKVNSPTGYGLTAFSLLTKQGNLVAFSAGKNALADLREWEFRVGVPLGLKAITGIGIPFAASSISLKEKPVQIVRLTATATREERFSVDDHRNAWVEPPIPFSGSARLKACASNGWRGNLKVSFPGEDERLTGARFGALLNPQPKCVAPGQAG